MIRLETENGWQLITHQDHTTLTGKIAEAWGNELFMPPEPRAEVLAALFRHDDGWRARDSRPVLTKAGKPSAFSRELVDRYTAYEEIEMQDYLAVRGRAVEVIAQENPFAAVLVSMHTCNLLTEHADRSTLSADDLPLLEAFVAEQLSLQRKIRSDLHRDYPPYLLSEEAWTNNFHFLQVCDFLSLNLCVRFERAVELPHRMEDRVGLSHQIALTHRDDDEWELDPFPLSGRKHHFTYPYVELEQKTFANTFEFQTLFGAAKSKEAHVWLVPFKV